MVGKPRFGTAVAGAVLLLASAVQAQTVHHVRAGAMGAGDGSSWADAFTELQHALAVAVAGDEVWVAEGTYTPAAGGLDPAAVFVVPSGAAILGGFAGTELSATQRDPALHVTTLSGDLLGDDAQGAAHLGDNSLLVLLAEGTSGSTRLDGLVIRDGAGVNDAAGLRVKAGSLTVSGCTFVNHHASALRCTQPGTTLVLDCMFQGNENSTGAAIYATQSHVLEVRRSRFLSNVATSSAGAVRIGAAAGTLHGCVFTGNVSGDSGGAFFASGSDIALVNCSFYGNVTSSPVWSGAAVSVFSCDVLASNCLFWGNSATKVYLGQDEVSPGTNSTVTLEHCLLEGWAGQFPGPSNAGGNPQFVDADGLDDIAGTADDDLRLGAGSPAIDSGRNAAVPTDVADADHDGLLTEPDPLDARRVGRFENDPDAPDLAGQVAPVVDRGAFEFSRWTNLGHALGGAQAPFLLGTGSWVPGSPLGLRITGAQPLHFGLAFVGLFALEHPFKGGLLVPHPSFLIGLVTNGSGALDLQSVLPAIAPSQFSVWFQVWFEDASAPVGHAATNALHGVVK